VALVDGVPLSRPSADSVIPDGSVPLVSDHVIDPAQHAESWYEYGDPFPAALRLPFVLMLIVPDGGPLIWRLLDDLKVLLAASV
jgi:hypothetical protein